MDKRSFLAALRKGLTGLPQNEIEERVTFYSEMIDDRMEEGLSEQEAVCGIGKVEEIIAQITMDTKSAKEKEAPRRKMKTWEVLLLILGSPIWVSLLIALVAVVFSVYVALWSVIISLWAVFGSVAACSLGGVFAGLVITLGGNHSAGMVLIGVGIVCAGLSVFLFYGCREATKGVGLLSKKIVLGIKGCFTKKETV